MKKTMIERVCELSCYAEKDRIRDYYNYTFSELSGDTDYADCTPEYIQELTIESVIYGLLEGNDNLIMEAYYRYEGYPEQVKPGVYKMNDEERAIFASALERKIREYVR